MITFLDSLNLFYKGMGMGSRKAVCKIQGRKEVKRKARNVQIYRFHTKLVPSLYILEGTKVVWHLLILVFLFYHLFGVIMQSLGSC